MLNTTGIKQFRSLATCIIAGSFFILAFFPALNSLVKKWSTSEDYTHAFFTVPIIVYMFWQERHNLVKGTGNVGLGLPLVIGALLFYLLSLQMQIPTFIYLAMVLTIVSTIIYLFGLGTLKNIAIPLALLFLVIPIPNQFLSMLTATLQIKVSQASTVLAQLFSIPIFREGNVLHIPDKTFQVVEACSGIRSLISLSTLSLIFSYFTLNRWWSVTALLLLSIPVAVVINILRVVSLVVVYHWFKIDLSVGTAHTVAGLVLFLFGLFLLNLLQRVLKSWEA